MPVAPLYFFLNICIFLKYSWLTVFPVHSKVIQVYIYTYIIFEVILHYKLLQDIDYNFLCYIVNLLLLVAYIFLKIRNLALCSSCFKQVESKYHKFFS